MATIDSDAHVIETTATWQYLTATERAFMPDIFVRSELTPAAGGNRRNEFWVIEGRLQSKGSNVGSETPQDAREMRDVERRLAHMDELGIDVQVLYPSLFLRPLTRDPALEFALARSYNRWLADIWKKGGGRLRWAAMPPLRSLLDVGRVRDELLFAKENGACAIFLCGMECDRQLTDSYFFPLYQLAGELDLAVCLHAGVDHFAVHDSFDGESGFCKFKLPVVGAFHALFIQEIPARFPAVRWGFVEVSAQWIPYLINDLRLRFRRRGKRLPDKPLAANNMYVACQVTDDFEYILRDAGEDNLVIGTDYGHRDTSTEIEALRMVRETGTLAPGLVDKILYHNPRRLYGLP
jgi:predicted TIM-barrel fold metal-dependent hydrolase